MNRPVDRTETIPGKPGWFYGFWTWSTTAAVLLLLLILVIKFRPSQGSYEYSCFGQRFTKKAADFTLTEQDGNPFRLSAMHGKVVLLTFGFTHCPNICPMTLANLAAVFNSLSPDEQRRVQVIFISVDPERDTTKVLKDYVPFFQPCFIGLTGSPDQIAKVAKDYGAYYRTKYQDSPIAANYYAIEHSTEIYLINAEGEFALLYNTDKLTDPQRMVADIRHEIASANLQSVRK